MASPWTFSQEVMFDDIAKTYARSVSVTCHYTLAVGFLASSRDWVGIFKVGWSTTKDYYNFVWVDPPVDLVEREPVRKQSLFREYYLPKEDSEFYQFCYVDSGGHVKGASTPFNFQNPSESPDCSSLDTSDLLVVTTQDEVDQRARESEELREALEQLRTGSQRALEDKDQEVDSLKEQNKARDRKERELMNELNQSREQNQRLSLSLREKGQEVDRLMEEILIQAKNHLQPDQHNASETRKPEMNSAAEQEVQEKYEQAVDQIKCLQEELAQQRQLNAQRGESAELTAKVRGAEGEEEEKEEMTRLKDTTELLRVDLRCSERDKERLSAELKQLKIQSVESEFEVAALKKDNQVLRDRLSQQEVRLQQTAKLQTSQDQGYQAQCGTMIGQLESTRTQLANERKASVDMTRRVEEAKRELQGAKERLHNADREIDGLKAKGNQLKLCLEDSHETIAEKDMNISEISGIVELRENRLKIQNQENEQLVRDNKLHLAESHKLRDIVVEKDEKIAEINGIVELRENRLQIQNKENEELFRENQRLKTSTEMLHTQNCDLQAAVNASFSPTRETLSPAHGEQSDLPGSFQFEEPHNIMGRGTNTQGRLQDRKCGSCNESFPGITQDELEQHEQSHRVCPFCARLCDHMVQAQYEDHVYSHQ